VSELAKDTGSSKATVHHILATLEGRRIVAREPGSFRYRLGWGAYELGASVTHESGFDIFVPQLISQLATDLGETTLFSIEEGGEVLVLYRGESTSSVLGVNNIPGHRLPMHATASGKTLLAFSPRLVARLSPSLAAYTPKTTISRPEVERQLRLIRERGYATCWEEHEIALNSIAVPVFGGSDSILGVLTVAGPSGRMNQRTYRRYLEPLTRTAGLIEEHLRVPTSVTRGN
jgi:DNA-binding IclR family transcriptional regulator